MRNDVFSSVSGKLEKLKLVYVFHHITFLFDIGVKIIEIVINQNLKE